MKKAAIEVLGGFLVASAILFPVDGMYLRSDHTPREELTSSHLSGPFRQKTEKSSKMSREESDRWKDSSLAQQAAFVKGRDRVPELAFEFMFLGRAPLTRQSILPLDGITLEDLKSLVSRGANPKIYLREDGKIYTLSELLGTHVRETRDYKKKKSAAHMLKVYGRLMGLEEGHWEFLPEEQLEMLKEFAAWLDKP